jgi:copper chaperone
MTTATYTVSGMTCEHCVRAVNDELSSLDGVTAVQVELVPAGISTITVVSDQPLPDAQVAAAVDEAGYELVHP